MMAANAAMAPRRAAGRGRAVRRPLLFRLEGWIALVTLGLLVFFFGLYLTESQTLAIRRVKFEGAEILSGQQILEAANITESDTLLSVRRADIRRRVMTLPYVRECEVKLAAFPATVIIRIAEREPAASVMVNNHVFEVAQDGMVLREVPPLSPPNGPLITNLPELPALVPGQMLEHPVLRRALSLWWAFSAAPVSEQITLSEISAEGENHLSMFFNELPYETRWGRTDFTAQVRRFEGLWREKQGALPCREYLDMRFDGDVLCK